METKAELPDSAAVFCAALSLRKSCQRIAVAHSLNLSESYEGMDQFMREVMRVALCFETWACAAIDFNAVDEAWPYLLEEKFGDACMSVMLPHALAAFNDSDCLRVAMRLRLPIKFDAGLPLPINVSARNPVYGSAFLKLRIQTVRNSVEDNTDVSPFTADDDPFDSQFGSSYFGLYGVCADGLLEHIADRMTYVDAVALAKKLAPGIQFPAEPYLLSRPS